MRPYSGNLQIRKQNHLQALGGLVIVSRPKVVHGQYSLTNFLQKSVFQNARAVVLSVVTKLQRLGDRIPTWQLSKLGSISDVCHGLG